MNTQKKHLAGLMLAMGLSGVAQAEIYTSTPSPSSPFGLTLDSGTPPWTDPNVSLSMNDTGPVSTPYVTNQTVEETNTVITPAQIGIDGSIDAYGTITTSYDSVITQNQGFNVNYNFLPFASIPTGTITGSQTYSMSGKIENLIGSSLIDNGDATVSVNMHMFLDSFVGDGSISLSFRMGYGSGQLDTEVFNTEMTVPLAFAFVGLGSDFLFPPAVFNIDLSGITYFEAVFSVAGDANTAFSIRSSSLQVKGALNSTSLPVFDHTETYTGLLSTEVIPALPAPVPEVETYSMMLAGLGLVGLMARRRKSVQS